MTMFDYKNCDELSSDCCRKIIDYVLELLHCESINYLTDGKDSELFKYKESAFSNYLKQINLKEHRFDSRNNSEIKSLYNAVIQCELEKMKTILKNHNKQFLEMTFYKVFSELAFFYQNFYRVSSLKDDDKLNVFKTSANEKMPLKYMKIIIGEKLLPSFKEAFSRFIAIDRLIIQIIFQLLLEYPNDYHCSNTKLSEVDISKIYLCAFCAAQLLSERDYFGNYIDENSQLYIADYLIYSPNNQKTLITATLAAVEDIGSPHIEVDTVLLQKLNSNFKKHYSFNLNDIDNLELAFGDETGLLLMDHETVYQKLNVIGMTDESKNELIQYLTLNDFNHEQNILCGIRSLKKRIYSNPFYRIGNHYIFSTYLFDYVQHFFIENLIYNRFEKCKSVNSKLIEKHFNKKFEIEICDILHKFDIGYKHSYTFDYNNSKIFLEKNNLESVPEIDALFVVGQVLYVVECKNLRYHVAPDEWLGDKRKHKQILNEIKVKVSLVEFHKDFLCKMFSIKAIAEIKPIIVYKRYNVGSDFTDKNSVTILTESSFSTWLQNDVLKNTV